MASKAEILDRQQRLAQLRRERTTLTQRQAGERLGVSASTINRDWQVVDEWFRREAAADIAVEKGRDLATLDDLIGAAMDKAKTGHVSSIRVINEMLARRSAILGYDAPTQSNVKQAGETVVRVIYDGIDLSVTRPAPGSGAGGDQTEAV